MILLDTNVVSEALRPAPAPQVVNWLNANFSDATISSITIFELGAGLAFLDAGRRKDVLQNAIARTIRRFGTRVYAFDAPAAQSAAQILARARRQGLPLHQIPGKLADLQIAGIASAYGLSLATRNVGDFEGLGLTLINPWMV
ncbi:MAG: type II toxin-antitoxin system VapC family toxin [Bradyrhizobium sp.]|jgi:toxin FitB|uniref:type II toxin-antitoxin system VapC family toxin n=1 Tax=Bradyrhizobium sp. TaxID=376 RepID=UPI003C7D66B9